MLLNLRNPYGGQVPVWLKRFNIREQREHFQDVTINLIADPLTFNLQLKELTSAGLGICGQTGSGKSVTLAALLEEFTMARVPFTVFDVEGDFSTLSQLEQKKHLIIEDGSQLSEQEIAELAELALFGGKQVVITLSEVTELYRMRDITYAYLDAMWRLAKKARMPHILVLDEAQQFIPESNFRAAGSSKEDVEVMLNLERALNLLATQGRKKGLHLIIASQRVAQVRKSVLTQLKNFILHKLSNFDADANAYNQFLSAIPRASRSAYLSQAKLFKPGEAFIVLESRGVKKVRVRFRTTTHAGRTPELGSAIAFFDKWNDEHERDIDESASDDRSGDEGDGLSEPAA